MNKPLVAIVDDDAGVRFIMSYHFEKSGFRTLEYGSGEELLDAMSKVDKIDAVLMDTDMSARNGYEICGDLQKSHPLLPVIGFSGNRDISYRNAWLNNGAYEFFVKPFDLEHVREALNRAISL